MRPITLVVAGVATSAPIVLDWYIAPFQVSVGVAVSGAVSYTLDYTYDDPFQAGGPTVWYAHPVMAALTTQGDTQINAGPVTAIRLRNAGVGTITARIIQAGIKA